MTTNPTKPKRCRRILIGIGILCLIVFAGIPTARVLRTRSQISSALRSASTVRLEEYLDFKTLTSRILTPAEYHQVSDAVPITWQVGIPGVIKRCFSPHHRVVITDTNQLETTVDICFTCEGILVSGSDTLPTPSAWRQRLRQLFLRHDISIRQNYPADLNAERQ